MLQHDALCIQHGDHDEGEGKHTLFLPTATQYGSVHWRFSDGRPTRSRYWNMQFRRTNIRRPRCLGEQGMALWWKHLSPTNVAHVQIPASTPYVGWVCCLFSSLLREVFFGYSGFPLFSETNISKFQFDQDQVDEEPRRGCATSSNRYLLFIWPCQGRCKHCSPIHEFRLLIVLLTVWISNLRRQ